VTAGNGVASDVSVGAAVGFALFYT
jgi:hypothetical protein